MDLIWISFLLFLLPDPSALSPSPLSPSFIHLISSYFPIPDTNKTMMKNEHHADECNDYLNAAFHYDYYWLELLDRVERRKEKRMRGRKKKKKEERKESLERE